MKKTVYGFITGLAAFVLGAGFFACDTGSLDRVLGNNAESGDITYDVSADGAAGTADSAKIDFVFSEAVTGLAAADIAVTADTGSAAKGSLSGSGKNWSLAIGEVAAGDVKVKISKTGIESAEKTVTVHKAGGEATPEPVAWTVSADGAAGTADSTKIDFVFSEAVAELTADGITLAAGTGAVEKGALTGDGTGWSLAIAVTGAGDITVTIDKEGVENGPKTVTVHKAGEATPEPVTYDISTDGEAETTASSKINFTFSEAVTGLAANHLTVTNDTGKVTKGTLSGSGTSWSLGITVITAGNVKVRINKSGIENTEKTVAAHKAPDPVTYTVSANGTANTANSTAIAFAFDKAVAGLAASAITVTADTGTVTKGALSGSGKNWSLGITVSAAGNVKVAINKAGIEDTVKNVTVHKQGQQSPVSWTAQANGASGTTASTKIDFTFSAAVTGLTAADIAVTAGTGTVTKGSLSGSGTKWSLGITVSAAGNVKVAISKSGIESAEKNVAVHKAADPVPDTAYSVAADGTANTETSTAIAFTFDKAVTGLTAGAITVTADTGSVTKGSLSGNGTSWSLGITVNTAGNVKVKISKTGIESAEKNVTVHKAADPVSDTTYSVAADGESGTTASTKIDFTFSAAVTGLTAEDIAVTAGTGTVTKGSLCGNGTGWSLGITVIAAGNVKVKINKTGIESAEKTVAVHKAAVPVSDTTYRVAEDGESGTTASTKIDFTFSAAVTGLTAADIAVTDDTGSVTKGGLTGNGTNWSLVITVNTAGNVKVAINKTGIESAEKDVTVHAVSAVPPESFQFIYKNTGTVDDETLEPVIGTEEIDNLEDALTWLEQNAENSTHYVVLVDDDYELTTSFDGKVPGEDPNTGIIVTLRGEGGQMNITSSAADSFFTVQSGNVLRLDRNIVIGNASVPVQIQNEANCVVNITGGALEMLEGAEISHIELGDGVGGPNIRSIIVLQANGTFNMKGGTIKDNTVGSSQSFFPSIAAIVGNHPISYADAVFNMYDGAVITGNKLRPEAETVNSTNSQNTDKITLGDFAAVSFSKSSCSFFMYGGTISGTNYRGVRIVSGTTFKMEGGTIENNGKSTVKFQSTDLPVRGGGLNLANQENTTITGGTITNNGLANSLGSGLFASAGASSSEKAILIDGPVNFDGNAVYISSTSKSNCGIRLGNKFSRKGSSPIQLEAGTTLSNMTITKLISTFDSMPILKSNVTDGADLFTATSEFSLTRFAWTAPSQTFITSVDINMSLGSDGKLSLAEK
jgi:hypothetical protein